jgi:hypothetical protein
MKNVPMPFWGGITWAYAALNEKDAAFDTIEKDFAAHSMMLWLRVEPMYDSLRSDPRFQVFLKRLDDLQHR